MRHAGGLSAAVRVLVLAAMVGGCASPLASLKQRSETSTAVGPFVFEFAERDQAAVDQVHRAVDRAGPVLARWGQIRDPIHVRVMPNHALLEAAVNRQGYDWLRAWAKYDEIFIQSPRTWGLFGGSQDQIDELVLHELTHSVMYQAAADGESWRRKQIPLWFREGMASYTARQGYRWPTLEDLARFYADHPGLDPVGEPDELYRSKSDWVYGAAHHAFTWLVRCHGEDAVRAVLKKMREGAVFPDAFTAAIGIAPGDLRRRVQDLREDAPVPERASRAAAESTRSPRGPPPPDL